MGLVRFSSPVKLASTPATARLIGTLDRIAQELDIDLVVTSAAEPMGRLPTDPHPRGQAIDIRTKDMPDDTILAVYSRAKALLGPLWTVLFEGPTPHPNMKLAAVQYVHTKATGFHFHWQIKKGLPDFGALR